MFWYLFTYIQELVLSEDDIASEVSGQTEPDKVRSKSKASKCHTAYTAKVKIISPNNVGGSIVQNLNIDKTYISVDDLKRDIGKAFAQYVSVILKLDIIIISPGHGVKGKLHPISSDSDLSSMYEVFNVRKNVMLWVKCQVKRKKRPASSDLTSADGGANSGPNPKRSGYVYHSTPENA